MANLTPSFFDQKDFDQLQQFAGTRHDKNDRAMNSTYQHTKATYEKVEYWAQEVQRMTFPDGIISIVKKPTNQASRFEEYLWAKLYPSKELKEWKYLAYTLTISNREDFCVKIDTVSLSDNDPIRKKYLDFRGDFFDSKIVKIFTADETLNSNWETLIQKSVEAIRSLEPYYQSLIKILKETQTSKFVESDRNLKYADLNRILYGPPGTGKTYNTINKAISIANPSFDFNGKDRAEIKKEYNRLFDLGRINFISFHQSLSYEDFIEGIKPQTLNNQVIYEVEPGLFKEFCNKARFINGNFDEVIEKFKTDISESDGKPPLRIKAQGTTFDLVYRGTNVFYAQPLNTTKENPWYPVNIENMRKAFESDSYDKIYNPTYVREVINHLKKTYGLVKGNKQRQGEKENYVLIIDEINRGNVSQIFGELITLIEPDKRENCSEALQIQLPYSGELFSVPDNVYILGTMNTADRSVEALDTALRRRFSFEFMPPDSGQLVNGNKELSVKGISLKKILDTMNERIAFLLDEDHQIGHAYFCSVKEDNAEQLKQVFKNKIVPLLREYFYNDHGKIRLILGDRFVEKKNETPRFPKDEDDLIIEKSSYRIRTLDDEFDIIGALREMLNG